jgi:EmrB/QacA subfamily drug resistance transporter
MTEHVAGHAPTGAAAAGLPPAAPAGSPAVSHRAVTTVVCLALAAVVSAMASLNVALPDIARSTHAGQTQLAWVIDAYSLVFAALLLPAGALGDRYGRRRALFIGLAVFGIGSAAAMTASSAGELIALRAVLGLGAALVMPATLSTITSTFPPAERTRAVGVWTGVAGGSAVLGLLTTGLLLEIWSWQSVFALNVVLAGVAMVGTLRVVPESADQNAPRLDVGGAVLVVLGLFALVYSIIEAPEAGWLDRRTLLGIAVAIAVLLGFIGWELRQEHPLIDPRVFRDRRLTAGSTSILIQFFAFFGFIFAALQYLQGVRGDSPLIAALSMLPMAAGLIPAARTAPILAQRFGTRRVCVTGLLLVAIALTVLSRLQPDSSYWLLLAGLVPLGVGMGTAMTPATSAITEALPSAQQGVGSALNDLSREVGGALGIAVIGSILTAGYRARLDLPGAPAAVLEQARDSFAIASHLGAPVAGQAQSAFVWGMHGALLAAAAAVLGAALAVAYLLRGDAGGPNGSDADEE